MQALSCCDLQIRIGADLNQMMSIHQFAGQQLLIPKHFAVADDSREVAVRGRRNPPAFRSQTCGEILIFKGWKDIGKWSFHRKAMFTE